MEIKPLEIIKPYRFIPKLEIENKANAIIRRMEKQKGKALQFPLDASLVAEFLGLDVVWDSIETQEKDAIAARILPAQNLIEINQDIAHLKPGFIESTIAHEIGHWVLHFNPIALDSYQQLQSKGLFIPVKPFICQQGKHESNGREWQAQYFASCLLMPKHVVWQAKKGKNLNRWQHLYQIADDLGVTISNLIHRLRDLNLRVNLGY